MSTGYRRMRYGCGLLAPLLLVLACKKPWKNPGSDASATPTTPELYVIADRCAHVYAGRVGPDVAVMAGNRTLSFLQVTPGGVFPAAAPRMPAPFSQDFAPTFLGGPDWPHLSVTFIPLPDYRANTRRTLTRTSSGAWDPTDLRLPPNFDARARSRPQPWQNGGTISVETCEDDSTDCAVHFQVEGSGRTPNLVDDDAHSIRFVDFTAFPDGEMVVFSNLYRQDIRERHIHVDFASDRRPVHYKLSAGESEPGSAPADDRQLPLVVALGPSNIWVHWVGTLLHFDGTTWIQERLPEGHVSNVDGLRRVGDQVVAVSSSWKAYFRLRDTWVELLPELPGTTRDIALTLPGRDGGGETAPTVPEVTWLLGASGSVGKRNATGFEWFPPPMGPDGVPYKAIRFFPATTQSEAWVEARAQSEPASDAPPGRSAENVPRAVLSTRPIATAFRCTPTSGYAQARSWPPTATPSCLDPLVIVASEASVSGYELRHLRAALTANPETKALVPFGYQDGPHRYIAVQPRTFAQGQAVVSAVRSSTGEPLEFACANVPVTARFDVAIPPQ